MHFPHRSTAVGGRTAEGRRDEHALMGLDPIDIDAGEVSDEFGVGQDPLIEIVDGRRNGRRASDRIVNAHGFHRPLMLGAYTLLADDVRQVVDISTLRRNRLRRYRRHPSASL